MPLLNCGNSSKLALYFIGSLVMRAFQRFPGRKRDVAHRKNQSDCKEYQLPLLTHGMLDSSHEYNTPNR
jgi:hypothetical protein